MRLFKSEMIFMPSSAHTTRPRYGGRGPRLERVLAGQPVRSVPICIPKPARAGTAIQSGRWTTAN